MGKARIKRTVARRLFVTLLVPAVLSAAVLAGGIGATHARAGASTPDALASDAYGANVFATLLLGGPITVGPLPAARLYQPGQGSPQNQTAVTVGPITGGLSGALVQYIAALSETASGSLSGGTASAESTAAHACLLNTNALFSTVNGNCDGLLGLLPPLVEATAIDSKVSVTCSSVSASTTFASLKVNGLNLNLAVAPNTTISIPGVATVVLNEQFPDSSGRGYTVNAIHIYLDKGLLNLIVTGDVVVGHAHASVDCGPGTTPIPPTGGGHVGLSITKTPSISVLPSSGQQFSYTIKITNTSTQSALVQRVSDALPVGLAPVSASGDLENNGFTFAPSGSSATWTKPAGLSLGGGQTLTETLVVQSVASNSVLCNEVTAIALPPSGSPATGQSADYDSGLVGCLPAPTPCSAAAGAVTTGSMSLFTPPSTQSGPEEIACNPTDGNLYFTEFNAGRIGKSTPAGAITEFVVPGLNLGIAPQPEGITAGPDGNVWFTEENAGAIGVITPSGSITEYHVPTPNAQPEGITTGPDGNLWFTELSGGIGKITTAGSITEFPIGEFGPDQIVTARDGALWFTINDSNALGRITTAGGVTIFPLPSFANGTRRPEGITIGSDGFIWFTEEAAGNVGRVSPAGIVEFPLPAGASPNNIVGGPDGALYVTDEGRNSVDRVDTSGNVTNSYPISASGDGAEGITNGPGGLWFVGETGNTVGQLSFS